MIDISDDERRRAFSIWLRTGRLPSVRSADGIELKFNPWHDTQTGRFTFAGAGRHYGQWGGGGFSGGGGGNGGGGGATESGDWPVRPLRPKSQNSAKHTTSRSSMRTASPSKRPAPSQPSARDTWTGGGFTGGGGGSFGGAGASGTWGSPEATRRPVSRGSATAIGFSDRSGATNTASPRSASAQSERFRTVVRNGYTYQIDARERTRRVSGTLTVADAPSRSRTSQRHAGGAERRKSDDGGHYIAARFNGPTEAFNHFAQDANFNRGGYRLLEDEWARDKRAGRAVTVKVVPQFSGGSVRPSTINVWWTVDGKINSLQFPNERSEKRRGGN